MDNFVFTSCFIRLSIVIYLLTPHTQTFKLLLTGHQFCQEQTLYPLCLCLTKAQHVAKKEL